MSESMSKNNLALGVLFSILAAAALACMNAAVKELGNSVSMSVVVFFRFVFSFLSILPWIIRDKEFTLRIEQPVHYGLRIVGSLLAVVCLFVAVQTASLVTVLLLWSTAPLFIPLLARIFYRVKTHLLIYIGIVVGFIGVVIVLHPSGDVSAKAGELIALFGGFCSAVSTLEIRILSKKNTSHQILFYYYLVSMVITGIVSLFYWQLPQTGYAWLMLGLVAIFGTAFQSLIILAVVNAPSRLVSPLSFTGVIWAGLLEYFFWAKLPNYYEIVGFCVIILSIIMVVYYGNKYVMPSNTGQK